MQTNPSPRFYYPELDGLRFIAFMLVFVHNASPILKGTFLERFSEYSWFGVDLFFCLSGFLITKLLITEHEQEGRINIRNFYIRRVLRIWPLYFFYLIIGAIIIASVEGRNVNLPWHIASLSTFTFNFAYFALLPAPILIFVHLWSISYEEQFYAVIPWLIRKLNHGVRTTKAIWLIVLFATGMVVRAAFIQLELHPAAIYFLPVAHFDSLLGGVALGLEIFDGLLNKIKVPILWIKGIVTVALIFLLPNNDVNGWGLMLTYPLLGTAMTLIIFLAIKKEESILRRVLRQGILVALGKISYGLYVFHFGAFTISTWIYFSIFGIQKIFLQSVFSVLIIAFVITVLFSILTFNFIEKPFLKLKSKFTTVS